MDNFEKIVDRALTKARKDIISEYAQTSKAELIYEAIINSIMCFFDLTRDEIILPTGKHHNGKKKLSIVAFSVAAKTHLGYSYDKIAQRLSRSTQNVAFWTKEYLDSEKKSPMEIQISKCIESINVSVSKI